MRNLQVELHSPTTTADDAFTRISEFERYPQLIEEVREVTVHTRSDGHVVSDWEVYFRNGPLRWSEIDYFQRDQRRIVFEQASGDFHTFRGVWSVEPARTGSRVKFEATFDFGIPSLVGILDPIAAKVLREGIAVIVARLLGDAVVIGDAQLAAAVARKLTESASPDQLMAG